jgi:hypothetical protein
VARFSNALCALGSALALAACGSSNIVSTGTGSGNAVALEFANCMRAHGVPSFPDPGAPPGSYGDVKRAPAFRSATKACDELHPAGRSTGTPVPEAQRVAALAQARCIRRHGVPNFPDPTFPSTGGEFIPPAPGFDPQAPAFAHAAAACGLKGTAGLPHGG